MNDFYGANMENRIKYKKVAESGSVRGFDNIEDFFFGFSNLWIWARVLLYLDLCTGNIWDCVPEEYFTCWSIALTLSFTLRLEAANFSEQKTKTVHPFDP